MTKLFKQLHRAWFLFWIIFLFFLFYPAYYLSSRSPKYYTVLNFFRKLNSLLPCIISGVYFSFEFEVPLSRDKTYVYCANHTSNLDIMIFCVMAKGKFHFMGKDELLQSMVLKLFFKTIDIAVNRENNISAFRAFKKAGDNLESGMSLIIFPEGKIDDDYPPRLNEFKNGPFRLAIEKNIELVPVSITNAWKILWDDGAIYGSKPGICDIYIHKPINTAGLTIGDAELLKQQVFDLIENKLK